MDQPESSRPPSRKRSGRPQRDFSQWGVNEVRAERPRIVAWAPGPGGSSAAILAALRAAGIECRVGSRREPVGNFEAVYMAAEEQTVRRAILAVDGDARPLTVGR